MNLEGALYELIAKTSTTLPEDVLSALKKARSAEEKDSPAAGTLDTIIANAKLAERKRVPLCQDTGTMSFFVKKPVGAKESEIRSAIFSAVRRATKESLLRPNAVDSVSGANSGDNTGEGSPQVYLDEWDRDYLHFELLLKGGGSENMGIQYSLPDERLKADRNLDGVRKCALDAVFQAQGNGCPPGVLAIAVGGDRASGYAAAKKLFFGRIGERSKDNALANMEKKILSQANELGIGPAGLGGATTLLDVKIEALHRNPPSFFVTVSHGCWALRRRGMDYKRGSRI